MLKGPQINDLPEGYFYITAITKNQIKTLIQNSILNHYLFSEDLHEVEYKNIRYIMRLNTYRRDEIRSNRDSKISNIEKFIKVKNEFLNDPKHKRAQVSTAYNQLSKKCDKIGLNFIKPIFNQENRTIGMIDQEQKKEIELLDGCYCLITDLPNIISKDLIHTRYKGLSQVERFFRINRSFRIKRNLC